LREDFNKFRGEVQQNKIKDGITIGFTAGLGGLILGIILGFAIK